ncbi:hypothetical protein [Rhodopirellula sallentina]|uniref:hypothetical protein n=1 Tax=Rhodopirellula sallentina TaxID=1263869 RepID=UPI0005C7C715|nr:hypothetical protein [Rhodopirellula sallentina]
MRRPEVKKCDAMEDFAVGDIAAGGHKIKGFCGANADFMVYFCDHDALRWQAKDGFAHEGFRELLQEFDRLNSILNASVHRRKHPLLKRALGKAFYNATVCCGKRVDSTKLSDVTERITYEAEFRCRFWYIVGAMMTCPVLASFSYLTYRNRPDTLPEELGTLSVGLACGAIGSLLSVLFRLDRLPVQPYSYPSRQILLGVCRTTLGSFFGAVFVVLVKAELLLGVVRDKPYAIAVFSFLSGFSERYVPSILDAIERGSGSQG